MGWLSPAQSYSKGLGDLKILKTPKMEDPDPRRPYGEKVKIGTRLRVSYSQKYAYISHCARRFSHLSAFYVYNNLK